MTLTDDREAGPLAIINRLLEATNKHDLEALAECFAPGYVNETPAHPTRGFTGRELHLKGARRDGTPHEMTGVIIFDVDQGIISSARFYLEPVEQVLTVDDTADRVTHRVTHGRPAVQPAQ